MADIVLVHGAWQGSWCWERLVPLLQAAGHRVATPTLTGSGSRSGELHPGVALDAHIGDVVGLVHEMARTDVVLVGHSYAGMVISGVAERLATRLGRLVYVDAFYPYDGESALDQMPEQFQNLFRQRAEQEGRGWRLPATDGLLDVWGLHAPPDRAWVSARLTDWSIRCFESPAHLPDRRLASLPRTYVAAVGDGYPGRAAFGPLAERAAGDGCERIDVRAGHDVMVEAPDELARIIDAAAAS